MYEDACSFIRCLIVLPTVCRTEIEQAKWVNTSRGVLGVLSLVSLVIIGMELAPKPPKPVPAPIPTVVVEREKPDLRDFEDDE